MLLRAVDQDMQQAESVQQQDTEQDQGPASTEKQWWHGTFVKAGRMGNMAADVLQRGPDKEVRYTYSSFCNHAMLVWSVSMLLLVVFCRLLCMLA